MKTERASIQTSIRASAMIGIGTALFMACMSQGQNDQRLAEASPVVSWGQQESEARNDKDQAEDSEVRNESPAVESLVEPTDTPASPSNVEPVQMPVDTDEHAQIGTQDSSDRLQIADLIDAPLGLMSPSTANLVNPPNGTDAFVITGEGYGKPGNNDGLTTVLALHSGTLKSRAVGNALFNRDARKPLVTVGDTLKLDGKDLRVSRVEIVRKSELETTGWIWENESNRVVVVTCLQRPTGEGRSVQNLVIEAVPLTD